MLYIIIAAAIIILGALLILCRRSHEGPRPAALQMLGGTLDLDFHDKDNSILERLKFFKIYDATTLQVAAHNVLRSKTKPPDLWLFDYTATVGLKENVSRVVQTTGYFYDPRM
ncbi:MAG: hypothetical protein JXA71_19195, partial [Chitinispirillaceae bacterium]|nr:hypothetical protein [Chitinispirillaceae bacterium]